MITSALPARIEHSIRMHGLFKAGDTVIVALSGGADSCALLDMLHGLEALKPCLVVAHLNHCLRGQASDEDERFAAAMASRYKLPFESRRQDVLAMARCDRLNLEDAGRRARLVFLEEIRRKWHAKAIALAHHSDDQAETVLMRLLRGAGMTGLSGMSYSDARHRIRPMLDISRAEIEEYLKARGISHREDASNSDTSLLRNRIRHELLPLLENYSPAVRRHLTATAALLADENSFLEQSAMKLAAAACESDGDTVICHLHHLSGQHPALRRRLFRYILQQTAGSLMHFSRRHIAMLEQLADSPTPNASINLPHSITARREYNRLILGPAASMQQMSEQTAFTIAAPGRYTLADGGELLVSVAHSLPGGILPAGLKACFDAELAPFPWLVRQFRNGDRMTPLGMSGSRKVKNIFIDSKVPLPLRHRIPLLFFGTELIWICGLRTSEKARISCSTTRIASVEYSPPQDLKKSQLACQPAA